MRILHVTSFGYPGGGAETYLESINDVLRERGHNVMVISSDRKHSTLASRSDREFKSIESRSFFIRFYAQSINLSAYSVLRHVLTDFKPDIVHFHVMSEVSPAPLFLVRNYPTVMTIHGPETFIVPLLPWCLSEASFNSGIRDMKHLSLLGYTHFIYFRFFQRGLYKILLKNVDLFIFPSHWIANIADTSIKGNVKVIPHGIMQHKHTKLPSGNNILFVGRLNKFKGVEQLLISMKKVIDNIPDAHLDIVGDGESEHRLRSEIIRLGLKKNVKLHGRKDNTQLQYFYKKSRLVVIPSMFPESFCLVGVEALTAGRPIVASGSGGMDEWLIDGQNGLKCDVNYPDDIASKIIAILKNRLLAEKMSCEAIKMSIKFNIYNHVGNLQEAYSQAIETANIGR